MTGASDALTAIELREPDVRPELVMTPGEAKVRLRELIAFVDEVMIEGEDYGLVDWGGARDKDRYILYQPGAQKLLEIYGYYSEPTIDKEVEDFGVVSASGWERLPHYYYRVRTRAISKRTGNAVGAAYGSASSRESNYLWRQAERRCPQCGKPNIRKSKQADEWYCWVKTGGCGGKWATGSAEIEQQTVGRVLNEDVADLANTVLKMAVKRSMVAAAIAVTRSAMLFTQDLVEETAVTVAAPGGGDAPPRVEPEPRDVAERAAPISSTAAGGVSDEASAGRVGVRASAAKRTTPPKDKPPSGAEEEWGPRGGGLFVGDDGPVR